MQTHPLRVDFWPLALTLIAVAACADDPPTTGPSATAIPAARQALDGNVILVTSAERCRNSDGNGEVLACRRRVRGARGARAATEAGEDEHGRAWHRQHRDRLHHFGATVERDRHANNGRVRPGVGVGVRAYVRRASVDRAVVRRESGETRPPSSPVIASETAPGARASARFGNPGAAFVYSVIAAGLRTMRSRCSAGGAGGPSHEVPGGR
ncbi:MAG: hypothetical protein K0S86_1376 [Geminicoccaceae bacterium]|nr:hypothetical protein [Geminicoccaceae bacterium]